MEQFEIQRISGQLILAISRLLYWTNLESLKRKSIQEPESIDDKNAIIVYNVWKKVKTNQSEVSIFVVCELIKNMVRHLELLKSACDQYIDQFTMNIPCYKSGNIIEGIASEEFTLCFLEKVRNIYSRSETTQLFESLKLNNCETILKLFREISDYFAEKLSNGFFYPSLLELIVLLRIFVQNNCNEIPEDSIDDHRALLGLSWIQYLYLKYEDSRDISKLFENTIVNRLENECDTSIPRSGTVIYYQLSNLHLSSSSEKSGSREENFFKKVNINVCINLFPIIDQYLEVLQKEEDILTLGVFLTSWFRFYHENRWKVISLALKQKDNKFQIITLLIIRCIEYFKEKSVINVFRITEKRRLFVKIVCMRVQSLFIYENKKEDIIEEQVCISPTSFSNLLNLWNLTWPLNNEYSIEMLLTFIKLIFAFVTRYYPDVFEDVEDKPLEKNSSTFSDHDVRENDDWDSWDDEIEDNEELSDKELIVKGLKCFDKNLQVAKRSKDFLSSIGSDIMIFNTITKIIEE